MMSGELVITQGVSPCLPKRPGDLHIASGSICCFDKSHARTGTPKFDAAHHHLLPGYIDQHVHGTDGFDVITDDDYSPEMILERWQRIGQSLARTGVVAYAVTLYATSLKQVHLGLSAAQLVRPHPYDGTAALIGVNLEGPYLNPAAAGAHRGRYLATPAELPLVRLIGGSELALPRMLTIAPELPGSLELIRECVAMGIICSIGHTIADAETISAAVRAGATCATHYGNAMGTFHQRAPGAIGELAIADEVMLEIVANEALLHPTVWSLARAAAGSERIILVSDNMPSAAIGKASEYYEFSGTIVRDDGDGVVTRVQDGRVWGNTRPMARLAAAYARETRCSLEELWQCTSANASRLLSLDEFGGLRPGQRGSIVVLDEICQLRATIIDGVVIHDAID